MERTENKELVIIELERQLTHCIPKADLRKLVEEAKEVCDSEDAVWLVYKIEKLLEVE